MARVASCPQCEHDLLVPDDAEPSALVKCPQCRAFFELQHAESRELPAALVVDSQGRWWPAFLLAAMLDACAACAYAAYAQVQPLF